MRTTQTPTPANRRPADQREAAGQVLSSLGRAVGSLRCAGSQRMLRLGISMTHFHVLTLLRHHGAMPMGHLAEILDASMSSATGIIDRMAERGLVERVRVPGDRRVVMVQPTQTGLDLVDAVELVRNDLLTSALVRLAPDQLARMAAAAADLEAAVSAVLAAVPDGNAAMTQCSHAYGQAGRRPPAPDGAGAAPTTGPAGA